jgi:hypothetical protein
VSADKFSREVFCRLSNGSYEVFEEMDGRTSHRSLWVSRRSSKVIDTLPFDVVPAEMQVTTNDVKHCKILYRGKSLPAPCRAGATSFSEYVAQQPKHVGRILSDCDLTETATQKLVSLLRSPGPVYGGTDDGTFGFVWGDISKANTLFPIGKGHVPGAPLIMSSTRSEIAGLFAAITHLRLVVEYYAITPTKTTSCRIYCDRLILLGKGTNTTMDLVQLEGAVHTTISKWQYGPAFCSCQSPFRGIG